MNSADREPEPLLDSTVDEELAKLLEKYLEEQDRGVAKPKEEWLKEHPRYADRLEACLKGAELFAGGMFASAHPAPKQEVTSAAVSISGYEILGELGRGGMGVVYEAREQALDRIVALKIMRFGIVDPKALDRFQREAETAGALHHTNIVPVYATGRENDTSWYAMQRIEGESLAHRIRSTGEDAGLPLEDVLSIGIQAADALEHAHQRDVIHRDVKPANLILDLEGRVWLTDFGLARRLVDVGATMTGAMLGTPRYMSPEQAGLQNSEVDHRSDIYSLGATLFEAATGRPPFDGDDPLKLVSQIRYEDPPSVRKDKTALPRDLEVVLAKCLEKRPKDRYQTSAQLADDLRAIQEDRPIRARPVSIFERSARWFRKHQTRVRVAGATVLLTAVAMVLALFSLQTYRESRLGGFRLRAGGGPYRTNIYPAGETSLSPVSVRATVPMQRFEKLPAGDYQVHLSPQSRWSRTICLPVTRGESIDYRLSDTPDETAVVPLDESFATVVAGDNEPAVVSQRQGQLTRTTIDGTDWTLDVSNVDAEVTTLDAGEVEEVATRSVDFANTSESSAMRGHRTLDDNPLFLTESVALRARIDIDNDGRADSIVAATNQAALLAVDADGSIVWARAYDAAGLPSQSDIKDPGRRSQKLLMPGVRQLTKIADVDGDAIDDVAATLIYVQRNVILNCDVRYVVLSGASGRPIHVFQPPTIVAADNVMWPSDGLYCYDSHQFRDYRAVSFTGTYGYRSSSRGVYSQKTRSGSAGATIRMAAPSPTRIVEADGRTLLVASIGDQIYRYDVKTGQEVSPPIKLPFLPATAPMVAKTTEGPRLIVHEIESNMKPLGQRSALCIAYTADGEEAWRIAMPNIDWLQSVDRNQVDWPMASDLDGDGNDELVLPENRQYGGRQPGIRIYSGLTGNPVWDSRATLIKAVDRNLNRITATPDLDGDGWKDLAIATLCGHQSEDGSESELFAYVDWISGKTGASLSWARHPLPLVSETIAVAEIDAIRSVETASELGTIEIDLVTGDNMLDAELASAVVRLSPKSPDAIAVAAGLDRCDRLFGGNTHVYRQRGGPFSAGHESLILMRDDVPPVLRLGESQLIATWKSEGRELVALSGDHPPRVTVVDAKTFETLWTRAEPERDSNAEWHPVFRDSGECEFLLQANATPLTLLDGDTGQPIFATDESVGGGIIDARFVDDGQSMLIVSDGDEPPEGLGQQTPNEFRMSLISGTSGTVRWSRPFLFGAARHNRPRTFDDLQLIDVNGDGTLDIVGPRQKKSPEILHLAAWDGATGDEIWSRSAYQQGARTEYFIPFLTFQRQGRPFVVYLGRESDERGVRGLLQLCDASTGERLSSYDYQRRDTLTDIDRDYANQRFAMGLPLGPSGKPELVTVITQGGRSRGYRFDLQNNELSPQVILQDSEEIGHTHGSWFRDTDGDGSPEWVRIDRLPRRDDQPVMYRFQCIDHAERTLQWERSIEAGQMSSQLAWQSSGVVWIYQEQRRGIAIDLKNGELLADRRDRLVVRKNLPRLVGDRTRLLAPTRDGISAVELDIDTRPQPTSMITPHEVFDPRRTTPLLSVARAPGDVSSFFDMAWRGILAFGGIVILPAYFLGGMIRNRRWSLMQMLLAFPVVVIWILVWQNKAVWEPGWMATLISGASYWLCIGTIALAIKQPDPERHGHVRVYLVVGTLLVFAGILITEIYQANDPTMRYTWEYIDFLYLMCASVAVPGTLYWFLRIFLELRHWLNRPRSYAS